MNKVFVKSSPRFYSLIIRAMLAVTVVMLLLSLLCPAPLQDPALLAEAPNPVKSAWFLLWIQELVSYRLWLIYPLMFVSVLFIVLPWLQPVAPQQASWFGRQHRFAAFFVLCCFLVVVLLTVIGLFFRGENWVLLWPL